MYTRQKRKTLRIKNLKTPLESKRTKEYIKKVVKGDEDLIKELKLKMLKETLKIRRSV